MQPVHAHARPFVSFSSLWLEQLEDRIVPAGLIGDLVSFGDSLSDVGNVFIATSYDEFPGTVPPANFYFQGRFSGGPIWLDTLAEYLGEAPSTPYFAGGLNYAFGGAPVIPNINPDEVTAVPTLTQQVGLYLYSGDGNIPDADDLFTIWAGANDFFDAAAALQAEHLTVQEVFEQISETVTAIGDNIELLHVKGGRQFVVANLPPLGETPFFQGTPFASFANTWTETFNLALAGEVASLEADLEIDIIELYISSVSSVGDVKGIFDTLRSDDNPLGLTNTTDAVGLYGEDGFLFDFDADADPDTYLFYDSVHPGSTTHQYVGLQAAAGVLDQLGISTVLVKTTDDVVDPLDGKISLREAVNLANAQAGEQNILFALGNGNKTIKLESELTLTGDTNIVGPGANKLTISGQNQTRIFSIGAGAEVTLAGMTLTKGRAEQGGAVSNAGSLTVIGVDFLNNTASGTHARGGAVYNTGELIVLLSTFKGNQAVGTSSAFGGAIASDEPGSSVHINLSQLTNNQARAPLARGGAIYAGAESNLSVVASLITGNKAQGTSGGQGAGGGVYVANDALFIQFLSLIAGNNATVGKNVLKA